MHFLLLLLLLNVCCLFCEKLLPLLTLFLRRDVDVGGREGEDERWSEMGQKVNGVFQFQLHSLTQSGNVQPLGKCEKAHSLKLLISRLTVDQYYKTDFAVTQLL